RLPRRGRFAPRGERPSHGGRRVGRRWRYGGHPLARHPSPVTTARWRQNRADWASSPLGSTMTKAGPAGHHPAATTRRSETALSWDATCWNGETISGSEKLCHTIDAVLRSHADDRAQIRGKTDAGVVLVVIVGR